MSQIVRVFVVSPDTRSERRLELHTTVQKLKANIELITGIPVANQVISLLSSEDNPQVLAILSDDSKQLGYYSLRDWQVLKVEDTNPSVSFTGQLTDVSQVPKFELSKEDYARRQDTVLAYKQQHKMGRFAEQKDIPKPEPDLPSDIKIGARCEVMSTEANLKKRGTVRFVGKTMFSKGTWVGIEYDEPLGKNDGSVQGEKYFTCRPNYGVFVHPDKVTVGQFPVEDISLEDDEI